jgi:hypothetical protein
MRRSFALVVASAALLALVRPSAEPVPRVDTGVDAGVDAAVPTGGASAATAAPPAPAVPAPSMSPPPAPSGTAAADGATVTAGPGVTPGPTDVNALLRAVAGSTTVAPGTTVAGRGPAYRFSVELEHSLELDIDEVTSIVEAALLDTERSWARDRTLRRIDDPSLARIRVVIATPATVDAICATVGLNTAGIFSCWTGRIAALNAMRWASGATGFDDLATYRTYLVNHEVGHAFGYGHVGCPAAGAPAPVMMQQSKGLAGCVANGWPHP